MRKTELLMLKLARVEANGLIHPIDANTEVRDYVTSLKLFDSSCNSQWEFISKITGIYSKHLQKLREVTEKLDAIIADGEEDD